MDPAVEQFSATGLVTPVLSHPKGTPLGGLGGIPLMRGLGLLAQTGTAAVVLYILRVYIVNIVVCVTTTPISKGLLGLGYCETNLNSTYDVGKPAPESSGTVVALSSPGKAQTAVASPFLTQSGEAGETGSTRTSRKGVR
ncbi:unnamed protein product [Arctogadus glacialis]